MATLPIFGQAPIVTPVWFRLVRLRFNAELKIMRSPLVRGSDLMLFPGLFAAHKGAGLEEGDQLIGRLEAPGA